MIVCSRCGVGSIKGIKSNFRKDGNSYVHESASVCGAVATMRARNAKEQKIARSWWRRTLMRLAWR